MNRNVEVFTSVVLLTAARYLRNDAITCHYFDRVCKKRRWYSVFCEKLSLSPTLSLRGLATIVMQTFLRSVSSTLEKRVQGVGV